MSDIKMCPLRKQTTVIENQSTEVFLPCIKNECEWWIPNMYDKTYEKGECIINCLSNIAYPA